MNLFGYELTLRRKQAPPQGLQTIGDRGNWWMTIGSTIREPFTGAWQRNMEVRTETALSYSAVYACISLISSDIAKLRPRLMEEVSGISTEIDSPAFSPVLNKPNRYQNRIQFFQQWLISKLVNGNAYILKQRDQRNVVTAMYVLDPNRVTVMQAPDGSIWYDLSRDDLSGVKAENVRIPATEIIHDIMVALYHPLVGVSPITAAAMAVAHGLNIQRNSTNFFANGSRPSGMLTAPAHIGDDTAARLKAHFEQNFGGENLGRIFVASDGLKFEPIMLNAVDMQLIEQLRWSSETVASVFHVPSYMIGIKDPPSYNNIEALNTQYYSQCLQILIESLEESLNDGLGLTGGKYSVEFDLEGLLRLDTATKYDTIVKGVQGKVLTTNDARAALDKPPIEGGDTVYMQMQDYPMSVVFKQNQALPPPTATPAPVSADDDTEDDEEDQQAQAQLLAWELKKLLAA